MQPHPLTREKQLLKDLASRIHLFKDTIKDAGVPTIPGYCCMGPEDVERQAELQKELAKLKYLYRHRHIAYCSVRQDLSGKHKRHESNPNQKLNHKLVNMYRNRLLRKIVRHQNEAIDNLLGEVDKHKPCIAIFTSHKTGRKRRLRIEDFERRPNGDWVWSASASGIVETNNRDYTVRDNDAVWITNDEYEKLPPELKNPDHHDPVEKIDGMWYFWDETWANKCGPWFTEEEARAQLKHYCDTVLNYDEDKDCAITPLQFAQILGWPL